MKKVLSALSLVIFSATQALTAGTVNRDAILKQEITKAIKGLETGGGEGDPFPYTLVELDLAANVKLTDQVLLDQLLPKLDGLASEDEEGMLRGLDRQNIRREWADLTAEPKASEYDNAAELAAARRAAKQWRQVKTLFDANLSGVRALDMGYRSYEGGSLETGAVAHVIVGRSASGRVFAIYGIDIWT